MGRWLHTLDIVDLWAKVNKDDDSERELNLPEFITELVSKMKTLPQWQEHPDNPVSEYLAETIHELEVTAMDSPLDWDRFDEIWNSFYEWCNSLRVWVKIH